MSTVTRITYRIKSTGESSAKFGPCEICGKHASEVFVQSGWESFIDENEIRAQHYVLGEKHFGHERCLIKQRKPA